MKAVFWSFFGVRKRKRLRARRGQPEPGPRHHRALIGVAIFIGMLLLVVRMAVAK
jgi:hypothetical protein